MTQVLHRFYQIGSWQCECCSRRMKIETSPILLLLEQPIDIYIERECVCGHIQTELAQMAKTENIIERKRMIASSPCSVDFTKVIEDVQGIAFTPKAEDAPSSEDAPEAVTENETDTGSEAVTEDAPEDEGEDAPSSEDEGEDFYEGLEPRVITYVFTDKERINELVIVLNTPRSERYSDKERLFITLNGILIHKSIAHFAIGFGKQAKTLAEKHLGEGCIQIEYGSINYNVLFSERKPSAIVYRFYKDNQKLAVTYTNDKKLPLLVMMNGKFTKIPTELGNNFEGTHRRYEHAKRIGNHYFGNDYTFLIEVYSEDEKAVGEQNE